MTNRKVYTKQEVDQLVIEFNEYLSGLLNKAELDSNPPMRQTLTLLVENQQVSAIRRLLRMETEEATVELIRAIVAKYNHLRNAAGQPPIFVLEDLFTQDSLTELFRLMADVWESNDRVKSDMFIAVIEPIVRDQWESVVARAAEINVDLDVEPLVNVIIQLYIGRKSQHSLIVKMVPRDAWTDAIIAVRQAGDNNPHAALLAIVRKNELAIMERAQDWGAQLDQGYLAYVMEHLIRAKFPEIPKPQLIM